MRTVRRYGSLEGVACDSCRRTQQLLVRVAETGWTDVSKEWWCLRCLMDHGQMYSHEIWGEE